MWSWWCHPPTHNAPAPCGRTSLGSCLSAAWLLFLSGRLCDKEPFEEEELQVAWGDDEEAEGSGPPGDVLGVGQQQEVVNALTHTAKAVVAEHVEDPVLQYVSRILAQKNKNKNKKTAN